MKRVLILADLYPPVWAPRIAYLTKYLGRYGWEAMVFTEQVNVHHTFADFDIPCPVQRVNFRARGSIMYAAVKLSEILFQQKERAMEQAILTYLRENPELRFDAILCFSYRKFPLRTAFRLAEHLKLPWIADCRDIIEQYSPGDWLPRRIRLGGFVFQRLERLLAQRYILWRNKYIRSAHSVVTVSKWHKTVLAKINPNTHLIYNGYDPMLFTPRYEPAARFRIVYTGRILSLEMRNPNVLLDALCDPCLCGLDIEVAFYTDDYSRTLLQSLEAQRSHPLRITYYPMVASGQVPELLHGASIILLLGNNEGENAPQGMVSTKLFEAMAVHKPLLLLPATNGEAAEILRASGCGIASDDAAHIARYIHTMYEMWQANGFTAATHPREEYIKQYSRGRQAKQFAELLDNSISQ